MSCNCCEPQHTRAPKRRRAGIIGTIFQVVILYLALVFGAGTLIHTGHPVAVELGKLIHVITFVDPAIGWADDKGYQLLSGGLRTVADGVDMSEIV